MQEISRQKLKDLAKPLKVHFIGEEGVDDGGLRKEFFQLLTQQILSPNYSEYILRCVRQRETCAILDGVLWHIVIVPSTPEGSSRQVQAPSFRSARALLCKVTPKDSHIALLAGMFAYQPETRTYYLSPVTLESETEFLLVGIAISLAIYNGVLLDVSFPQVRGQVPAALPSVFLTDSTDGTQMMGVAIRTPHPVPFPSFHLLTLSPRVPRDPMD